jgi:hypothetical protein
VTGCCEHGNGYLGFLKCDEIIDQRSSFFLGKAMAQEDFLKNL